MKQTIIQCDVCGSQDGVRTYAVGQPNDIRRIDLCTACATPVEKLRRLGRRRTPRKTEIYTTPPPGRRTLRITADEYRQHATPNAATSGRQERQP